MSDDEAPPEKKPSRTSKRRNPNAEGSDDEAPKKKPSRAKKPPPSSKGTKTKEKAPTKAQKPPKNAGVTTPKKQRGNEIAPTPTTRKSPRLEIEASRNIAVESPAAAAAASTLLYSLHYGGGGGDRDEEGSDYEDGSDDESPKKIPSRAKKSHLSSKGTDDDDDFIADGLIFSDDEDFLIDVDSESEDERLRSSFPKDRSRKPLIPGGPQPPVLSNYPESEQGAVWAKYVKERKKYVDSERHKRLKGNKSVTKNVSYLCGDQTEQLRVMSAVEKTPLSEGDIFKSKDVLALRIAEEANLRGISTRVQRSDVFNFTVVGINF